MLNCYFWLVTLFALAVTNGQVKLGSRCRHGTKVEGKCGEFIRCSSAQYTSFYDDSLPPKCGGGLICCDDFERKPFSNLQRKEFVKVVIDVSIVNEYVYNGTRSEKKCREYSKWYENSYSLLKCGITNDTSKWGEKAGSTEFPHMAQLGYETDDGEIIYKCIASLISDKFLLTAAHCIDFDNPPVVARFGTDEEDKRIKRNIEEIIIPPNYIRRYSAYNDIALIKLKYLVLFTNLERPACLFTRNDIQVNKALFSGYKKNYETNNREEVFKVTISLLDYPVCKTSFFNIGGFPGYKVKLEKGFDDEIMICMYPNFIKTDNCPAYYGGPLQIADQNQCMYHIMGIQSLGSRCGYDPGIYTRVSKFIPWIESIVWPFD